MAELSTLAERYIKSNQDLEAIADRLELRSRLDAAIEERKVRSIVSLGARTVFHAMPFIYRTIRFQDALERNEQARQDFPLESFPDDGNNSQSLAQAAAIVESEIK